MGLNSGLAVVGSIGDNLVRDEIRDKDSFDCHAFRPKLSVVNRDDTEQSQTEDASENTESMSQREKWFKAYAVQQLEMNPDLIYANLRYHVVFSTVLDASLQGCMHRFEDEVPIHSGQVDILQLTSRTRRAIGPAHMPTDEASHIVRSRQFFNEWHFTPYADDPLCHAPCCVIHERLYCASDPPSTLIA